MSVPQNPDVEIEQPHSSPVLLVCKDIIFTARIVGTCQGLGRPVYVAVAEDQAFGLLEEKMPGLVLVDLTAAGMNTPAFLAELRQKAPSAELIAFGPHVDEDALKSAKLSGFNRVMARSQFTALLASLITG